MEMKEGHILWLREYKDIDAAFASEYRLPHQDIYNHPVLIVRAFEGSVARVCVLTSSPNAGGDFFRMNLAIYPQTSPDPDLPQLHLLNDKQLRAEENGGNGYVNPRQTHLVHRRMLSPICRTEDPEIYCLTRGSLARVRSMINDPLPADVELRHLSEESQSIALKAKMARLETKLNKVEKENERLRAIGSEVVVLRQIEGEAARLRGVYPDEASMRVLQGFIEWKRRVGDVDGAGFSTALSAGQGLPSRGPTKPAERRKSPETSGQASPSSASKSGGTPKMPVVEPAVSREGQATLSETQAKPTIVQALLAWLFYKTGQP